MKNELSKETFTFLGIVQDVLHIFVTEVVILVRRLLLNKRSDNYWFCPSCTKPALHAVFVEKDIEERCQLFFETVEKRIKKIEEGNTSIFSSLETVMKNTEDRNITIRSELDKLEDRKIPVKNKFLFNNPQQINQMKTRRLIQSRPIITLKNL